MINYLLLVALLAYALIVIFQNHRRTAQDVFEDLKAEDELTGLHNGKTSKVILTNISGKKLSFQFLDLGIFSVEDAKVFYLKQKLLPIVFSLIVLSVRIFIWPGSNVAIGISTGMAFLFGLGFSKNLERSKKAKFYREIDFFLPLIMERIVMAVQSGLDIIPALRTVLDISGFSDSSDERQAQNQDSVSKLFGITIQLCEAGVGFQESLEVVSSRVGSGPLRHAFVHLGLAQKEGGELIKPLRELSDSTQLYFQESVEEEIARMPVKATMPLLCTFAGLIICFLTVPIVQIVSLTTQALPQ